jgi:8-oxo-dGTP diphosphatase
MDIKTPLLSVDAVLFDTQGRLLLVRRKYPPYQGQFALPGGFVDVGETVEHAVLRELREETGIEGHIERLVGVYSDPARDPRRHNVSVAFLIAPTSQMPVGGDDAETASFEVYGPEVELAFDHALIVADAMRLRSIN